MSLSTRRRSSQNNGLDAWPGYVDALSTLLMVIIFVLLVFVLGQAFLSVALTGKDRALDKLGHQVAELSDMLSLVRGHATDLESTNAGLGHDLAAARTAQSDLSAQLSALQSRDAGLSAEHDALAASLADAQLQARTASARTAQLEAGLADTNARAAAAAQQAQASAQQATTAAQQAAAATQQAQASTQQAGAAATQLADARNQLSTARAQVAERDRVIAADRDTIQARLSQLATLGEQTAALSALRDELERQVRDAAAHAATATQQAGAAAAQLADEQRYSDSARAQIALLNHQLDQLRAQMQQASAALDLQVAQGRDKDAQIAGLGQKLNVALASKVEELQRYRSEFFGRLRAVLADRPGIQVVGDRFVFQSEVLFPPGGATLSAPGEDQVRALATTLKAIVPEIPTDLAWLLRVDGHADHEPTSGGPFASNWELSSQRAITVVRLLIASGIPADHLAATGFADFQPLAAGSTPEDYARNRRIELRLTDR